ncbi:MAG: MFS transporter, partial [Lawsonibacter sp.]
SAAFWFEGAFILLLALLVLLLVRDRPENLGLLPYHLGGEAAPIQPARPAPSGMTQRRWAMVLLAIFLIGGPTGIGISHVGVLYTSEGYNSGTVAVLVSWIGVWLIVGKLIYGELTDRLGSRRSNYLLYGLALASFLLFCLAPLGGIMPAFAAVTTFGLGMPISNVALSTWARDLRGDAGFAEGLRWSQTLYALGLLLTGPIPGILADSTGSYVPSYVLFFLMMLLSMSLLLWVYGRTRAGDIPAPHP